MDTLAVIGIIIIILLGVLIYKSYGSGNDEPGPVEETESDSQHPALAYGIAASELRHPVVLGDPIRPYLALGPYGGGGYYPHGGYGPRFGRHRRWARRRAYRHERERRGEE